MHACIDVRIILCIPGLMQQSLPHAINSHTEAGTELIVATTSNRGNAVLNVTIILACFTLF